MRPDDHGESSRRGRTLGVSDRFESGGTLTPFGGKLTSYRNNLGIVSPDDNFIRESVVSLSMSGQSEVSIPRSVSSEYGALEGMRPFLIGELFERIALPEELQAEFWQAAVRKESKRISVARVTGIQTRRDGTVTVVVANEREAEIFTNPPAETDEAGASDESGEGDITDAQLAELKTARTHGLTVTITYQVEEDGRKPIMELMVHGKGASDTEPEPETA